MKRYVLAMTGASGTVYGVTLLAELLRHAEVHIIVSSNALPVLRHETGLDLSVNAERLLRERHRTESLFCHDENDLWAPISSGSFRTEGMLVVPCSMKTLAAIASGYAGNLIERAADVTLKEGRHLLLSPREMPFSAIHLENMLRLARLGVKIAPPIPGFYGRPDRIDDIVNFVVGKVLDCIGIDHRLSPRWGDEA